MNLMKVEFEEFELHVQTDFVAPCVLGILKFFPDISMDFIETI